MKNKSIKTIKKRTLLLTFIAIIILIISAGYYFYQIEENSIRKQQFNELSAIAQLKINQIIQWRSERLSEAEFFSTNQTFIHNTASLLAGRNKKLFEGYFAKTLLPIEHNHGYGNIYLVSKKDQVLFSLNKNKQTNDIDSITIKDIDSAIKNRKIIFSDFHFSANHKIIHLNIIAPILGKNKIPIAALIFRILPNDYLYPLIRQWPIPSKTSETLIVRKDGDNILFLNELRYKKNAALNLRIPLTRTDISEVKGVLGYKGIIEGKDYRDVRTLADIRPIPGTTWFMASKVDQSEIYSELHFRAVVISIMVFVLIFSLGMGLIWFYYLRQRNIYKTLWQTQEEFRTTLYSIGDAVITTDKFGIVKHINHVAEHLTGWNETEAKGKPLLHVFKIINEDSRKIVESPIKKVLSEGLVVGLANHTLLISKDGKEIPIADSGAPIKDEDNKIIGVVIVFRDQTDERLARKALEASERKFRHTFELASIGKSLTFLDGKLVDVNDAFCKMIGYSKDELATINFTEITYPDDLEASKKIVRSLLAGEKETFRIEKRYVRKDGNVIWADVNTMLLKDSGGKPEYFITHIIDITERKRAEQALYKNEERLRIALESTNIGLWDWNLKRDVWFATPMYFKMLGYDPETEEQNRDIWWEKFHPDDKEFATNKMMEVRAKGENGFDIQFRSKHADGSYRWINSIGRATEFDETGKAVRMIGLHIDITERKLAEEKILNANRVYAVISQINQTIVRIKDRDELFKECCRIAIEFGKFQMAWFGSVDVETGFLKPLFQAGKEDGYLSKIQNISIKNIPEGRGPTGKAIREKRYVFCNDIENDPIMAPWKEEALKRNYRSSIALPIKPFGKVIGAFTLYSSVLNFFNQEEINLLEEVANNISFSIESIETEKIRKETEYALRESEERLRLSTEFGHIAVWEYSFRTNSMSRSKNHDKLYGLEWQEKWDINTFLNATHPDDRSFSNEFIQKSVAPGGQDQYKFDFRVIFPDLSIRWLEVTGQVVERNLNGQGLIVRGCLIDISDRKYAEEEIEKLNADLEQRVIDRTVKLEAANIELEAFAYSVSHDLRAPLRGIDGFANILLEEYYEKLDEEGKRLLNVIRDGSQKMGHLIDDLLAFSRIGRRELAISQIDMKTLANSIYYEVTSEEVREKILFSVSDLPYALGDTTMIRQLWTNLLSNAVKFSSKKEKPVIEISSNVENGKIVYCIKDNGVGFDMRYYEKLFGVFQRLHSEAEFQGTGVGLAIAKRIVTRHGGNIRAESGLNVGATFYFSL